MNPREHADYPQARALMATMIANSQRPGEGNTAFIDALCAELKPLPFALFRRADPVYSNREVLAVDIGDPQGEQVLVTTSHTDVVGVEGQHWTTKPWELTEADDQWFGRGTCDTHGTGVSFLLAGLNADVRGALLRARRRVTVLFTYDEEAASLEFSMRGARQAAGLLGTPSLITAKQYIVGEPTELDGRMTPMRGHKGRLLAHFHVSAPEAGHVSQCTQNALMAGASVVHEIAEYGRMMHYGSGGDEEASIFHPPHTTVHVSAADVKKGDFSSAPSEARFTLDMRTLPFVHALRVREMTDLVLSQRLPTGESVRLHIEKDGEGSMTRPDAPIVLIAEAVTGEKARGFNGGDEGRILRNKADLEGVTLGPGDLRYAHMPDERIAITSVLHGADVYGEIMRRCADLPSVHT